MNAEKVKNKLKAKRSETKERLKPRKIEMDLLKAYLSEKREILKEKLEIKKIEIKSKKIRIKLCRLKFDAEEIAIPVHILRLAEVIAESAYDYEVPYILILNSENIAVDIIPLTHPNVLKKRDREQIDLDLHDFTDKRFILCHTHPNGFVELSEEECELKRYINLAVHVIHPLQCLRKLDLDERKYLYIDKATVAWRSKYFKHILKIHSEKIERILII